MDKTNSEMAKQVAFAAMAFETKRIGRAPESVTTVMMAVLSLLGGGLRRPVFWR